MKQRIIIKVIGRDTIECLEDFKSISRDELINDECKNVVENNKDYILTKFTRTDIRFNQRHKQKTYGLTAIKGMVKKLDNFKVVAKNYKNVAPNKKTGKVNFTCYTIVKLDDEQ